MMIGPSHQTQRASPLNRDGGARGGVHSPSTETDALEPSPLAIQPRRRETAAPVEAEVGAVVPERPVPDCDIDAGGQLNVVLLLCQMALDVEDDLAALRQIERPPL